jgi:hypothetical protein
VSIWPDSVQRLRLWFPDFGAAGTPLNNLRCPLRLCSAQLMRCAERSEAFHRKAAAGVRPAKTKGRVPDSTQFGAAQPPAREWTRLVAPEAGATRESMRAPAVSFQAPACAECKEVWRKCD